MTFGTVWRGLRSGKSMSAVRLEAFLTTIREYKQMRQQFQSNNGLRGEGEVEGGKCGEVGVVGFLSGCCSDPLKQFIGTTAATATDEFSRITSGPTRSKRDCIDIFFIHKGECFCSQTFTNLFLI